MNADQLLDYYEQIADAPGAISRLRQFVMDLAVRGRLVEQNPKDEPASELLNQIEIERSQRMNNGEIRKAKPFPPIEEPPFDLPDSWVWLPLGQTGNIFTGNSINAVTRERLTKTEDGYPFIATKDIGYGHDSINYENGLLVSTEDQGFKVACKQSVLICAEGGSAGRKIGITDREICFGNKLLANETWSVILPRFVMFVYLSGFFYEQFAKRMTGIIGGISINRFLQLPFPLPSLAEQYRIVEKVDELMLLCGWLESKQSEREVIRTRFAEMSLARLNVSNTNPTVFQNHATFVIDNLVPLTTHLAQIKFLRQTILNLAVCGKLVNQDSAEGTGSDLLAILNESRRKKLKSNPARKIVSVERVSESEKYMDLPASWAWTRIREIGMTQTGTTPSSSNANLFGEFVPFVKPADLDADQVNYDGPGLSEEGMNCSRIAPKNTVLMVCIGATLGKVSVTDRTICFNQQINSVTPYLEGLHRFLVLALKASCFQKLAWSRASTATLPIISKRKWEVLPIPLPPLVEQHRIVAKVDELMVFCDQLEANLSTRDKIRCHLLDALLEKVLEPIIIREEIA